MPERVCLYAGSFDPVTVGHMDIIERASALYDRVVVAVSENPGKRPAFTLAERIAMMEKAAADLPNVRVVAGKGLTVDTAREYGAGCMVRGLRGASDFDGEWSLCQVNRSIAPELETVFLMGRPEHSHVSSSAVREMASFGLRLEGFVPECVRETVLLHYKET